MQQAVRQCRLLMHVWHMLWILLCTQPVLLLPCGLKPGMPCMQRRSDDQVTERVDVFSFGICLWEIWTLGQQVRPLCSYMCILIKFIISDLQSQTVNNPQQHAKMGNPSSSCVILSHEYQP